MRTGESQRIIVSALGSVAGFGKLLRRVENVRQDAPGVLDVIGEESRGKGTDKLTSRQVGQVIKAARSQKPKRG